jgi:uncharacterized protein with von Willebrand factor type A (vWA) domain
MFLNFFYLLKKDGLPVSLHEFLAWMEALEQQVVAPTLEEFYFLSKSILVKHENQLDRFDQLFGQYFHGKEAESRIQSIELPEEWLRKFLERNLTDEEKALIEAMGGLEKLQERFEQLLREQKERHEGGNKWIGTGGTSPFGANGYNPEGYRIGQEKSRNRSAVKVWDQRKYANLDDDLELNTRNLKLALKRLRILTREGAPIELDLDGTIKKTSENAGMLDIHMVPSKKNHVKVLLFIDVGGSMDDHIETCAQLFSAARYELKHLEYFYFHNCLYESVWKDNNRRGDRTPTWEVLHKYNRDYKVIFLGDAAMSPYEVVTPGASVEHYNQESGAVWMQRVLEQFPYACWINPNHETDWRYYESTTVLRELMGDRMFPMTLKGIGQAVRSLKDKRITFTPIKAHNLDGRG